MAYQVSGNALVGGFAFAAGYIAEILVSAFGGGIIDRFDRRLIFGLTMLLKSVAFFSFLVMAMVTKGENIGSKTICAFAFVIDLLHHCSRLANTVSLYQIFDGEERSRVQGLFISISGLCRISGPALAGTLATAIFPNTHDILWICLPMQAVAWFSLKRTFPVFSRQERGQKNETLITTLFGTINTIRYAFSTPNWRTLFTINALATVFLGTANLLFFPFFRMYFEFSESQCGNILSAGAAGAILGGIGSNKYFQFRTDHAKNAAKALICSGLTLVTMTVAPKTIWVALGLVALFQIGLVFFFRSIALALTENVEKENLGKWWTANDAVNRIFGIFGILAGAAFMDHIGAPYIYQFLGIGMLSLAGFLMYEKKHQLLIFRKVKSCQ
jgi:MFS family permease